MGNENKWGKRKNIILILVLVILVASVLYASYMFFHAPAGESDSAGKRVKTDYLVMGLQCTAGSVLLFLPGKLENKLRVRIPSLIQIQFFVFLFLTIYLGGVRNFYYHLPLWDRILHFASAGMLSGLGYYLLGVWSVTEDRGLTFRPGATSFLAFCFAMTGGAIWEIYEFLADGFLGTDMQKYISYERELLVGREVLYDTMGDMIANMLGSLVVVTGSYFYLRNNDQNKNTK